MIGSPDPESPLRVVFFGTAELAVPSLRMLAGGAGFQVVAVVTQPDRAKGRELHLQPSAVKRAALTLGLPVLQPERCRAEAFLEVLRGLRPALIVVAAYGQILPPALLALPPHGCVNVHASILPRHRGAAPIQWALLEGDAETGVTIMKMDAGLDTGDILEIARTRIGPEDTAETLHDRLAGMGAELLAKVVPEYVAGRRRPVPQPGEGATYARKLTKEDGRLRWSEPAVWLARRVRALTPWPGAYGYLPGAARPWLLKCWAAEAEPGEGGTPGTVVAAGVDGLRVACGEGRLRIVELQREGGRRMGVREFLAGHPLAAGEILL